MLQLLTAKLLTVLNHKDALNTLLHISVSCEIALVITLYKVKKYYL